MNNREYSECIVALTDEQLEFVNGGKSNYGFLLLGGTIGIYALIKKCEGRTRNRRLQRESLNFNNFIPNNKDLKLKIDKFYREQNGEPPALGDEEISDLSMSDLPLPGFRFNDEHWDYDEELVQNLSSRG